MRRHKIVKAATYNTASEIFMLTPSALLSFLSQISELDGQNISVEETPTSLIVSIGDNQYTLITNEIVEVADDEVVDVYSYWNITYISSAAETNSAAHSPAARPVAHAIWRLNPPV